MGSGREADKFDFVFGGEGVQDASRNSIVLDRDISLFVFHG